MAHFGAKGGAGFCNLVAFVVRTRWSWRNKWPAWEGKVPQNRVGVVGRVMERQTQESFKEFLEVPILIRI